MTTLAIYLSLATAFHSTAATAPATCREDLRDHIGNPNLFGNSIAHERPSTAATTPATFREDLTDHIGNPFLLTAALPVSAAAQQPALHEKRALSRRLCLLMLFIRSIFLLVTAAARSRELLLRLSFFLRCALSPF